MADKPRVTLVAAMASNRVIGAGGEMPWHLPAELHHFKRTTLGRAIVMGRRTWESIGRPLPGRQNIVVSRQRDFHAEGCTTARSLEQAIAVAESEEVMIVGGGELYRQAVPIADRMVLTVIDCRPEGDTWFPAWREEDWKLIDTRAVPADGDNPLAFEIREYRRVRRRDG